MSKPHILVTGSSGYLASNLIEELSKNNNYNLTALDIEPSSKLPKSVNFQKVNISNADQLNIALDGVDLICHCASLGGTKYGVDICTEDEIRNTNIEGTQNIYQQAKKKRYK